MDKRIQELKITITYVWSESPLAVVCSLYFLNVQNILASFSCTVTIMGVAWLGHVSVR